MAVALAVNSYCNYTRGIGDEFGGGGGGGGGGKLLQSFEFSGGMQLAKEAKLCCRSRRDCDFREKADTPDQIDVCKNDHKRTHETFPKPLKAQKRKLEADDVCERMVKRVSPFLNTPKQRKEERKRIWRVTLKKLRLIDDPEHCLYRSVLINNTMKKLQEEIQEEKMSKFPSYCSRNSFFGDRHSADSKIYDDAPIHSNLLHFDDPFTVDSMPPEKITDDMTDELMNSLDVSSAPVTECSTRLHEKTNSIDDNFNNIEVDVDDTLNTINTTPTRSVGET